MAKPLAVLVVALFAFSLLASAFSIGLKSSQSQLQICPCDYTQIPFEVSGVPGDTANLQVLTSDPSLVIISPTSVPTNFVGHFRIGMSCKAQPGSKLVEVDAQSAGGYGNDTKLVSIQAVQCNQLSLIKLQASAVCPNVAQYVMRLTNNGVLQEEGQFATSAQSADVQVVPTYFVLAPGESTFVKLTAHFPPDIASSKSTQTITVQAKASDTSTSLDLGLVTPLCPGIPGPNPQTPGAVIPEQLSSQAVLPEIHFPSWQDLFGNVGNITGNVTAGHPNWLYALFVIMALLAIVLYSLYREKKLQESELAAQQQRQARRTIVVG